MVKYHDWELQVSDVKRKMERGELIPGPEWQRGYIWKLKDEQLLVDSILKGLPIPKFYLTQEYAAKQNKSIHYAVDGQQRLRAIDKFLNNELQIKIKGKLYRFKDLDRQTQQQITTYKLNGHYMTDYKQVDVNFLFQRLNRTGIKLTNMEVWNNEYFKTNVLNMVKEIYEEMKGSYDVIYTEENIKRKLPLDDIIDLCNCLQKNSVEGGSKKELESFLKNNRKISGNENLKIKSKFKKTINNINKIFSKQDLESSDYGKRTHFISLALAAGLLIHEYYILSDVVKLKKVLLKFIDNQPEKYKESVLGAIRQKAAREKRVNFFKKIILKYAKQLDTKRFFEKKLLQKLWRINKNICQLYRRDIRNYKDATLDHKIPWAKGGRTLQNNAQLAHKKCNQRKRDALKQFVIT